MNISALIENKKDEHVIVLSTDGREQSLTIQPKLDGFGSSANGGELLGSFIEERCVWRQEKSSAAWRSQNRKPPA